MIDDMTIGFIGLGNMGGNMARHLAASGFRVLGYDANPEARARFAQDTGAPEPTLADIAGCGVVWTMLPTGQIVREVMTSGGADSLVNRMQPGALFIDTTSAPPELTREMGTRLTARGIAMIDAGVSGGHRGAIEGDLVFMVGCDDSAVLERARVPLSVMSQKIFHLGPLGSGHRMKSLNNFVSAACFAASCEALYTGAALGLDPAQLIEVLKVSTGQNDSLTRSMPKILDGSFRKTFSLGLFTKDIRITCDQSVEAGVDAPLMALVHARMAEALSAFGPDVDHSFAYKLWSDSEQADSDADEARSGA